MSHPEIPAHRPRLSACVVNFDGAAILEAALAPLLDPPGPIDEVILVDDASRDASVELVERRFPDVRVIRLPTNRGPGAARNAGFRAARGERVLFVDNDVALLPGCATALDAALDACPTAVAAMPRVVSAADPSDVHFTGADCHYLGGMIVRRDAPDPEDAEPMSLGSIVTACLLLDRGRWGTDDPFDASFRFNYEDHDFGLRARSRGHRLLGVPGARARHGAGTPGLSFRPGGEYPAARVECLVRNRWQILAKTYELRTLAILAPMLLVYEVAQLAGLAAGGWGRQWGRSLRWCVGHAGEIRAARREVQARRVLADRELLCGGPLPLRDEFAPAGWQRIARRALDALAAGYWRMARRVL